MISISFCIFNQNCSEGIFDKAVANVLSQHVPDHEIFVYGELSSGDKIKIIPSNGSVEHLSHIRNVLCTTASKEFIALMANNIELSDGWYEAIKEADYLDIIGSRILTDSGARALDWACQINLGSKSFPYPLDYDEWTTKAYVSGNLMLLRKRLWERIKFDETLSRSDCDGVVDFCLRATNAGFRVGVIPEAEAKYNLESSEKITEVTFEKFQNHVRSFKRTFAAGENAFKLGDYKTALAQLTNATDMVQDDPLTLALMGWSYYFMGRYENALEVFDKAIAIDSANHSALRGRGWTFLQSRVYPNAISDLIRALENTNSNQRNERLEAVRGLAWSHYHNGSFKESKQYFDLLLNEIHRDETDLLQDAYRGSGWCCYRMGVLNDAADYFEKALSNLGPSSLDLIQEVKRGLELIASDQRGKGETQNPIVYPNPYVSEAHLSESSFDAAADWRPSFVARLKAAARKILNK